MVPYAWRFSGSVGRVLVAWDGSREAARAVNDALPLLSVADWVQLLAVNPAEQGQPPLSCRDRITSYNVCYTKLLRESAGELM